MFFHPLDHLGLISTARNFVSSLGNESYSYFRLVGQANIPNFLIFLGFCFLAIVLGRITPLILRLILDLIDRKKEKNLYDLFVRPIQRSIKVCTSLLLIYWAARAWLDTYKVLSGFLEALISLVFFGATAWIVSRVLKQFIRLYGIRMLRNSGFNVNEILLVFEAIANIMIGFVAIILYAESQNFPWIGLFAGASLGGVVLGLAVSKTAEDFLATLLLYLDNRFLPGDYIRLPQMGDGRVEEVFGRVESIGWRSTTIRVAGKNTIYITSNAILVQQEIENVSRGKRIMVLLSLKFSRALQNREQALIKEFVVESTETLYGIAANSTSVKFAQSSDGREVAMINFAILGSSETSFKLRKDILESACEEIATKLKAFEIEFVAQEPTVYIEAPVTI